MDSEILDFGCQWVGNGSRVKQKCACLFSFPETNKSWEQVILEDFDDLEKSGLKSPEFAKIREMLKPKKVEVGSAAGAK